MSYHDFRKYLRDTGPELITYEQRREIIDRRMKEVDKEYKLRRQEQIKDSTLTRSEGFSFLLNKLLNKNKGGSLTLDEIKELKAKRDRAKDYYNDCREKLGVRELVQGKGVVKSGPTEEEIKNQQFERIQELLKKRNKFDTWILHDDPDEKKEKKTLVDIDQKTDLMKIVEQKKQRMKKQSIRDVREAERARKNLPTLPFYF